MEAADMEEEAKAGVVEVIIYSTNYVPVQKP